MPETVLSEMGDISSAMKGALAELRGKCPECGRNLVSGIWLKWCSNLACQKFVGPR